MSKYSNKNSKKITNKKTKKNIYNINGGGGISKKILKKISNNTYNGLILK